MNARPGPLEGLAMLVGGVVVLALTFAVQADALPKIDFADLFARSADTAVAESQSASRLGS